jgi:hypothetical protein
MICFLSILSIISFFMILSPVRAVWVIGLCMGIISFLVIVAYAEKGSRIDK